MAFVDYYEVLQISRHSSADNIKAAYRTMCKRYHPDTYHGSRAVAERNIRLINEAYGVLRHPADKARYDAQYDALHKPKARPACSACPGAGPPGRPGEEGQNLAALGGQADAARLFHHLFCRSRGAGDCGGRVGRPVPWLKSGRRARFTRYPDQKGLKQHGKSALFPGVWGLHIG